MGLKRKEVQSRRSWLALRKKVRKNGSFPGAVQEGSSESWGHKRGWRTEKVGQTAWWKERAGIRNSHEEGSKLQMTGESLKIRMASKMLTILFCLLFILTCTCRIWQDTKKQKESMFHVCVDYRQRRKQ